MQEPLSTGYCLEWETSTKLMADRGFRNVRVIFRRFDIMIITRQRCVSATPRVHYAYIIRSRSGFLDLGLWDSLGSRQESIYRGFPEVASAVHTATGGRYGSASNSKCFSSCKWLHDIQVPVHGTRYLVLRGDAGVPLYVNTLVLGNTVA